jgi:hypothetical protein
MAAKKKAASSGSDRGAKMKADAAKAKSTKKAQEQATRASNFYNMPAAQKKAAQGTSVRGAFTTGNRVLPNSYGVSGQYLASGATTRRGIDQAKRKDAKKVANAKKVAKGKR